MNSLFVLTVFGLYYNFFQTFLLVSKYSREETKYYFRYYTTEVKYRRLFIY